jgi:uncharacterized protein YoxC
MKFSLPRCFKTSPEITRRLDWMCQALKSICMEIKAMSQAFDRLTADVNSQGTVIDSLVTLVNGLAQQIRDTAGNETAANALADQIEANTKKITDAVAANTPAAPVGTGVDANAPDPTTDAPTAA